MFYKHNDYSGPRHVCDFPGCNRAFRQRQHLYRHQRAKHGAAPKIVRGPPLLPELGLIMQQADNTPTHAKSEGQSQSQRQQSQSCGSEQFHAAEQFATSDSSQAEHTADIVDLENQQLEQVSMVEGFEDASNEGLFEPGIGMLDS